MGILRVLRMFCGVLILLVGMIRFIVLLRMGALLKV